MSNHSNEAKQAYSVEHRYVSIALLRRGYGVLRKAPGLENLQHAKEALQSNPGPSSLQLHEIFLSIDATIDAFCICTAVECAIKAFLVDQKLVVHSISKANDLKLKTLKQRQKTRPVTQFELLSAGGFPTTATERIIDLVDVQTISLSTMLGSRDYYEMAGLSDGLAELLKKTSDRRNIETHYFSVWLDQALSEIIDTYSKVQEYFDSCVVGKHNELVEQSGYPASWKIAQAS
ncbi:MAG TPA: hypothetical protein VLA61_26315 [Ideonella sp.]|uniref:hypothetical protein n=1 Tax=Ideonella sp. TaxID=1929293 RepID=UPI002CA57487|nr:hypothetical protein [Ideonella sp.]HSI51798.1 hypothetical protein [Ideonella sp.]